MRGNGCLPILQPGFGHMPILGLFKMIDENVPNELAKGNTRRLCFGQQAGFDLLRNVDGDSHMPVFSQIFIHPGPASFEAGQHLISGICGLRIVQRAGIKRRPSQKLHRKDSLFVLWQSL